MKQIKPESLLSVNLKVIKRHPFFFLAAMVSAFLLQFTAGLFPAFIEKQMFSFFENKIDLPLGVWFIIILDESTAKLDNTEQEKIQLAFNELIENKTAIIIAHRTETLEKTNVKFLFENGKLSQGEKANLSEGGANETN